MESIAERFEQALERMEKAARRSGRKADEVRLIVVTKAHPADVVAAAVAAGARHIGENYVEEALAKQRALPRQLDVQWHMIGHVQSRKAAAVAEYFDYLHSLDSLKLAQRLDRFAAEQGRILPVLLECNVSGEESKSGFAAWDENRWPELREQAEQIVALTHLQVRGLMTMPPFSEDADAARPYFRRLRRLRDYLAACLPAAGWAELSMGMSADFEVAIEEGATWVRVGTAIVGPRPKLEVNQDDAGHLAG